MTTQHLSSQQFKHLAKTNTPTHVIIRKQFDTTTEALPDRCVKFTISTDAVDRQQDRIRQDGWMLDAYQRNPVVLWGHNQDEPPIGRCVSIGIEDGKLKAVVQFMPESIPLYGCKAEAIYRMCCEGYLNATSVGFRPVEWALSKDPERGADQWEPGADFIRTELVEFSIVSVPCNPEALIEATPLPSMQPDTEITELADNAVAIDMPAETAKRLNTETPLSPRERWRMQAYWLSNT